MSLALLLACSPEPQAEPVPDPVQRPDIVLVSVDTLRADRMSLYGYERPTTPKLERLGEGSVVFERAIAPAPWTLPSMVSLFTGLLPTQHGVTNRAAELAPEARTLAEKMNDLGYQTAFFGVNAAFVTGHGMEQGFQTWSPHNGLSGGQLNQEVRDFLGGRQDPRPLFLVVHYFEPHCPYRATRDLQSRWMPQTGPAEPLDEAVQEALGDCFTVEVEGETVNDLRVVSARYDQEVLLVDRLVTELWSLVEPLDPVFGLVADHGEAFWEHGVHGHGEQLHQEQVRVPMLLRSSAPPERVSEAVSTLWMHEALLELAQGRTTPTPETIARSETGYGGDEQRAVFTNDLNQIRQLDGSGEVLYRLAEDPGETQPRPPDEELSSALDAWPEAMGLAKHRGQTERERRGLQELGYIE